MAFAPELTQAELERMFVELAERWHNETGMYSISRQKVGHPAYLRIIGLGPRAIPFVLRDLERTGGWWFDALQALTGENPADTADQTKPSEMRAAWLRWAASQGFAPAQ